MESSYRDRSGTVVPIRGEWWNQSLMDNLEGLVFGKPATDYYVDASLKLPFPGDDGDHSGNLYYYHPSALEQEIRRIFDRATNQLTKQTA